MECGKPLVKQRQQTGLLSSSEGERRVVTVLFADVSGFTAMSEKMDPEEVSAIMNAFFQVLSDQIFKFGGTIDKYIGDCIMALFGAPIAHEDDAERAVGAAWEMQVQGGKFADDLEERTGIRLKIRIGLNTGLVVAGSVGAEQRRDYTVLGDTVNLASRLESNARPGHILVSRETSRLARRVWLFETLEPIKVKGKEALIPVFEVKGPRAGLADGEERPAFTGRAAELKVLREELSRVSGGRPSVVALVGEAGIGKSRLCREFLRQAAGAGARILRGRCLSYQETTPYSLLGRLLVEGFGIDGGSEAVKLYELCVRRRLPDPHLAAEALYHVLGRPLTDPDLAGLSSDQLRAFVNRTMCALLRAEAAGAPLVVSLNDIHWIDSASADFVAAFLEDLRADPAPVLALLLYRPEGEGRIALPEMDLRRLRLGPMTSQEAARIVASILEGQPDGPAAAFLRDAAAKAEGNPFYLCELVRSLTDQEVLVREGGAWVLRHPDAAGLIPVTIHGAVSARIDQLSMGSRQVVQVGAVFGRTFSKRLVGKLLQNPGLEAELAELVAGELVYTEDSEHYTFSQAIIQEAVYQGLLVRTRRELHRLVGTVLEEDADDPAAIAPLLAMHFQAAEDDVRALKYLLASARRDAERHANREARTALEAAVAIRERLDAGRLQAARNTGFDPPTPSDIALRLGLAAAAMGDYDAALAAFERVLASGEGELLAAACRAKGEVLMQRGDYAGAVECFEAGLGAAPEAAERARILVLLGIVAFRQGDYDRAIGWSEQAIAQLDGGAHPREIGRACNLVGLCLWRLGRLPEAIDHLKRALSLRESARDLIGVGDTLFNLASIATGQGRWKEAVATGRKALEIHFRLGDPQRIAQAYCNVGIYEMDQGDLEAARKDLSEAVSWARRVGDRFNEALAITNLGEVAYKERQLAEAEAHIREALPLFEALQSKGNVAQALLILGEVLEEQPGREAEAWDALSRGLSLAEAASEKMVIGMAYHRISRFYLRARRLEEALAWASKGVHFLQETQFRLELARAYLQLGDVLGAQNKADLARGARGKAIELFEALGAAEEAEKARALATIAPAG